MSNRTVSEIGERALIERITARLAMPSWVVVGPGDDAAVIEPERGTFEVLTTDVQVEGIHFDRTFVPPDAIGHRALAVNLSDVAAMGGRPRVALLSLVLPDALDAAALDGMLDGALALAAAHGVTLVGGNISRSPGPLVVDMTVSGTVRPRRVLTRAGARPGDEVYVTGTIGEGLVGLRSLQQKCDVRACEAKYLRPEPRVRAGMLLGRNRAASACIDLSDGLADGVRQLAEASHAGITLDASTLPIPDDVRRWHEARGDDMLAAVLGGGDDYELLFTIRPAHRRRLRAVLKSLGDLPMTRIGVVTKERQVSMTTPGGVRPGPRGVPALSMTRRVISQSVWRKLLVTFVAIVGFVLVYEVTMFDSRDAARQAVDPTAPVAGARLPFSATAYCKGTTTASGVGVRTGIAASDPAILPVGSVVNITTDTTKYNGVYTIMDTGPKVQGRILDLYMWSCNEALVFGRKAVQVTVLRLGWNPNASSPSLIDRLFRRREAARSAAPPPLPPPPASPAPASEPEIATIVDGETGPIPVPPGTAPVVPASVSTP